MKEKHERMINEIKSEAAFTATYTGREKFSPQVMKALEKVKRENFVPAAYREYAYDNTPLPIGHGQTISQPYIVALMTDLLDLTPESIVLEIGTGSGYQAAILSALANHVYSIERVNELAELAAKQLKKSGCNNIELRCDNGYSGWKEHAPYDAIIVTAAVSHIPPALIEQLKPGGRMVVPVGLPYMHQELILLTKNEDGSTQTKNILDVSFVPLVTD